LNIERAVIRIDDGAMVVTATTTTTTSAPAVSKSLSEEAYFDLLRSADPSTAAALESFATKLRDVGVIIDVATKSAVLKWSSPSGRNFTLGAVDTSGRLITWSVGWGPKLIGQAKTGHWYLERLATLMGAQVKHTKTEEQWYIVVSGTTATLPHAKNALDRQDEWMSLVVEYQKALTEAEGAST
jgi:hypothetical protein